MHYRKQIIKQSNNKLALGLKVQIPTFPNHPEGYTQAHTQGLGFLRSTHRSECDSNFHCSPSPTGLRLLEIQF